MPAGVVARSFFAPAQELDGLFLQAKGGFVRPGALGLPRACRAEGGPVPIAAEAGDHALLADGPPHPDAALLDASAEALHLLVRSDSLMQKRLEPVDCRL